MKHDAEIYPLEFSALQGHMYVNVSTLDGSRIRFSSRTEQTTERGSLDVQTDFVCEIVKDCQIFLY